MKKAIVKMRISTRAELISTLGRLDFNFTEPFWQHDRIFTPRNYSRESSLPRLILRTSVLVPNEDPVYSLLMRRHINNRHLDYLNEFVISNYTEAAHMLYQLGYELRTEFGRQRQILSMSDDVKIYIDHLDGTDQSYAKIETNLRDNDDPELAYQDLLETFKVLEIVGEPVEKTYAEIFEESQKRA